MERIGEILVKRGIITEDVVKDVLAEQELSLKKFGDILIQRGIVNENVLIEIIAEQNGYSFIDNFSGFEYMCVKERSGDFFWKNCCVLVKNKSTSELVFVFNSSNTEISSYITFLNLNNSVIKIALCSKSLIYKFLSENIKIKEVQISDGIKDNLAEEVFETLEISIIKKASNLRIKKSGDSYFILTDTDTGVEVLKAFSISYGERIINILANICKVSLKAGQPLEAKFVYTSFLSKENVDIRVEFLPVSSKIDERKYFEAVLRIHGLNKLLTLSSLGFNDYEIESLQEILTYSYGLILSAGPTGAGKSTTFYSILKEIAKKRQPILTIEDPVEIKLNEINITQMSVNEDFRYDHALTAMLRCEPKIVFVGEIRDVETAKAVIRAAQTGHLVLSTVHTQSAIGAISRLNGMGVDIAEFLEVARLVTSQRLYLPLCPNCKQKIDVKSINKMWIKPLNKLGINDMDRDFYAAVRGNSCDVCSGTGYLQKRAVIEMLPFTEEIVNDIKLNKDIEYDTLRKKAISMLRKGIIDIGQLFNIAG